MCEEKSIPLDLSYIKRCIICNCETSWNREAVSCTSVSNCQFIVTKDEGAGKLINYAISGLMKFCYQCGHEMVSGVDFIVCDVCSDAEVFYTSYLISVKDVKHCIICSKKLNLAGNKLYCSSRQCKFRLSAKDDETVTESLQESAKKGEVRYCYICGCTINDDSNAQCKNGCAAIQLPTKNCGATPTQERPKALCKEVPPLVLSTGIATQKQPNALCKELSIFTSAKQRTAVCDTTLTQQKPKRGTTDKHEQREINAIVKIPCHTPTLAQMEVNSYEVISKEKSITIHKVKTSKIYEDKVAQIARYKVDSKSPYKWIPKTHKVLMIMGATGAGKTTLLNGMVNYIFDVRWEDSFRFILVTDDDSSTHGGKNDGKQTKSQTQSQTQWITAYTISHAVGSNIPYDLTIIDTPGFGDTRGLERDKDIVKQVKQFFSDPQKYGIDHLDGIAFVAQAPNVRLTATQNYIFNSVLAIFGKDMASNIYVMATFADGMKPKVFEAVKQAGFPCCNNYFFNNSALYTENNSDSTFAKMFWDQGITNFSNFFNTFATSQSKSLVLTTEVLEMREHLEACIQGLQPQINEGVVKISLILQDRKCLKEYEESADKTKNYTTEHVETRRSYVPVDDGKYVTHCRNCDYTCHYPCEIPHDENRFHCAAMSKDEDKDNRRCTVCRDKCIWSDHVNVHYHYVREYVKQTITIDDIKKRYEEATEGKYTKQSAIAQMTKELHSIEREVYSMIQNVHACIKRLGEIALQPHSISEVDYIDLLISSEELDAKPGYKGRIEQYMRARKVAELMQTVKDVNDSRALYDKLKTQGYYQDTETEDGCSVM